MGDDMIPPNCESIDITIIQGQLTVVVNFVSGFVVWVPSEEQIEFDDDVKCKDIEKKKKKKKDDDNDDEDDD